MNVSIGAFDISLDNPGSNTIAIIANDGSADIILLEVGDGHIRPSLNCHLVIIQQVSNAHLPASYEMSLQQMLSLVRIASLGQFLVHCWVIILDLSPCTVCRNKVSEACFIGFQPIIEILLLTNFG